MKTQATDGLNTGTHLESKMRDRLTQLAKRHPSFAFALEVISRYRKERIKLYLTRIAYLSFLSLFPLLLVFSAVLEIVFLRDPLLRQRAISTISTNFPFLTSYIKPETLKGSVVAISAGVLTATWSGLRVTTAVESGLRAAWQSEIQVGRSFLRRITRGAVLLVVLGAIFILSNIPASLASYIQTHNGALGTGFAILTGYFLDLALFVLVEWLLGPPDLGVRAHLPACIFTAGVWLALQRSGAFLMERVVSHATNTYGTFGVIIGFVVWLTIGSALVLGTAVVNSVLFDRNRTKEANSA